VSAWDTVQRSLDDLCDQQPFEVVYHLRDLRSGAIAERDAGRVVPAASVRKVAILMAALGAVAKGSLDLDQPVTIDTRWQNPNNFSGCFQYFAPGFTVRLRDVLIMMIVVSDNTATATAVDLVGLQPVRDLCTTIGMAGTTHLTGYPDLGLARDHPVQAANATTAADVGLLLDLILRGADDEPAASRLGSTRELCRLALQILSWQKYRGLIPALLPELTRVAHKTGVGFRNYNDAGIVYRPNGEPLFILSAFTDHVPANMPDGLPGHAAASHVVARLARAAWDALA
jgi:beta-lactamase class A